MCEEQKNLPQEIAIRYIQENYNVSGGTDRQEFVTSADIVRELSEMIMISITEITKLMNDAGFRIQFVEGKPHWIIFLK